MHAFLGKVGIEISGRDIYIFREMFNYVCLITVRSICLLYLFLLILNDDARDCRRVFNATLC